MRVLMATTVLPNPSRGGGEVVTARFVEAIARAGCEIDVVGLLRAGDEMPESTGAVRFHAAATRPIETAEAAVPQRAAWAAAALARREPFSVAKYRAPGYRTRIERLAGWDVGIVDHLQVAFTRRRLGQPWVFVDHNLEHAMYAGLARDATGPARRVWQREARLVEALERRVAAEADAVWTLAEPDAAALRRFSSAVRVLAVPGAGLGGAGGAATPGRHVAVLGTWTWDANLAGLRWLLDEVAPLVGDLEIVVGGRAAERAGDPPPGVRYAGWVPDAGAFLAGAAAIAVPAVAGTGVQVKTLDAIASGTPVVVTPIGLRGIEDPPADVRVAADAQSFAAALREAVAAPRSGDGARWAAAREAAFDAEVAVALAALR